MFEVASVRLGTRPPGEREKIEAHPGSLMMRGVRMRACIMWAYSVKDYQISGPGSLGSPGWLGRELDVYDIAAKTAEGTPVPDLRRMLQVLLADRVKLAVHRETKEVRSYALALGKKGSGPNLHSSEAGGQSDFNMKQPALTMRNITMSEFADFLSGPMHAPVVDKSGLQGPFDLTIDVTPYQESKAGSADQEYAFLTALAKQLGLILTKTTLPLEILVVDHVERIPTGN
jgi:uncharacterized protein (TIGR03435 family)